MKRIVEALELPKDLCLGALNVKLIGQYEALIENYKCIIEYGNEVIKLQGKNTRVKIQGKNLKISYFIKDDMRIKGLICQITFY